MIAELPLLSGRVDRDDAFVGGDPDFVALNARAGGMIGRPLAVPQLASVARLARRLDILVSRGLTIADGDADFACWVRAMPASEGVTVTLSGLRERAAWRSPLLAGNRPEPPDADWEWETDAALRVTHLPVEAGARHGFDAAAALGQPLTRLFALDGGEAGTLPILEALAARRDFDGQAAILRGSGRAVRLAARVRRDVSGGFAGFIGGATMIVDPIAPPAKGLSSAFSTRLDRVLRGPLGIIIANADSINAATDGPLAPHYADYAADIASAARHLMGLIDDLVDLEAIERDDFRVEAEPIDLADVARRAAGLLTVRAADSGVGIERPSPDAVMPARGEFRRTLQILVNLIGNAVRYAPRGTAIGVSVAMVDGFARVTVADRGKGIAPADQARIFDKFERVDPGESGGSGLGLYIARRLARAMGGDLTVASTPGTGASFILSLPPG